MRKRRTAARSAPRAASIIVGVVLATMAVAGCLSMFPPLIAESDGSGVVTIAVQSTAPVVPADAMLDVELRRDDYRLHRHVPYDGQGQTITIEHVAAGSWDVRVMLVDDRGIPIYEGAGIAHVNDQSATRLDITLHPRPGQLEVAIALGEQCTHVRDSLCLVDAASAGRLYIHPGVKETTDRHDFPWTPGQTDNTLRAVSLPFGSYDFQLVFYEGSRIPANQLFESFWIPVDILPGGTTRALWHPEVGLLDVNIEVIGPPQPPRSLQATMHNGDAVLTWDPAKVPQDYGIDNIVAYKVYGRPVKQEAFQLLAEVPAPTTKWIHAAHVTCDDGVASSFHYAVTAVNGSGYESLRSNEATACIP